MAESVKGISQKAWMQMVMQVPGRGWGAACVQNTEGTAIKAAESQQ